MDKEDVVYVCFANTWNIYGILLSHKNELNLMIYDNIDDLQDIMLSEIIQTEDI